MNIVFRVDSSTIMGIGHIMRCLTLADNLAKRNATMYFISQPHQGNINAVIEQHGHALVSIFIKNNHTIIQQDSNSWLGCLIEEDAQASIEQLNKIKSTLEEKQQIDWLIIDHYAINDHWHTLLKPHVKNIMVIDDLANRQLHCDLVLDQTLNRKKSDYQPLVQSQCKLLLGQEYVLLRDEFYQLREQAKIKRLANTDRLNSISILISMGGSDPDNVSKQALLAIQSMIIHHANISVNLVISNQSQHLSSLQQLCETLPWCNVIINCQKMAKLMLLADIAIGASGSTAWERCCLGLPSLTVINAENQKLIANNLAAVGASINLGWFEELTIEKIAQALTELIKNPLQYITMVEQCFNVCDGQGAIRVANKVLTYD